ncbi:MAG: hypothetical protein ACLFUJ_10385 [Phycisphaerae bacterium]
MRRSKFCRYIAALILLGICQTVQAGESVRISANRERARIGQPVVFTVHTEGVSSRTQYLFEVQSPGTDRWVDHRGVEDSREGQFSKEWGYTFNKVGTWKIRVMADLPGPNRFDEMEMYVFDSLAAQPLSSIEVKSVRPSMQLSYSAKEMHVDVTAVSKVRGSELVYRVSQLSFYRGMARATPLTGWIPGGRIPFVMDNSANGQGLMSYQVEIRPSSGNFSKKVYFSVLRSSLRHPPRIAWAEADVRVSDPGMANTFQVGRQARVSVSLSETHERMPARARLFALPLDMTKHAQSLDYLAEMRDMSANWVPSQPGEYLVGVEISFENPSYRKIYYYEKVTVQPSQPGKPTYGSLPAREPAGRLLRPKK